MQLTNSTSDYGVVTKTFHWLTALLILTLIPLGLFGEDLPQETSDAVALKAFVFTVHKTLGVTVFFVALLRILWAIYQPKPAPLHPERRVETFLAEVAHWCLYAALVVVPVSGWIGHASAEGFAPIYWPFGQSLPFVPKSPALEHVAFTTHHIFTKVLIGALVLHAAGALKHALIDRDDTLARMWFGKTLVDRRLHDAHPGGAILLAAAIYVFGGVAVVALSYEGSDAPTVGSVQSAGEWQVQDGEIVIAVRQMGSEIEGRFSDWTADIAFDETAADQTHGDVTVTIRVPSLSLGSVTDQAMGEAYFDADAHPEAIFDAEIIDTPTGYVADGTLSLAGATVDVNMPFDLSINGNTADMNGEVTVDRRDFSIGAGQTDPGTLGFEVDIRVALTASRDEED